MKTILTLLTTLLLAPLAALHAADDLPEPPVSWQYPPEMPGASVEVYREVNGVKLNAYIFTPPGHRASDRRAAVLFFFGGGWKGGSPGQFLPQSLYLAERGMVAIPCDYRVLSRHGVIPQDCLRDAKAAIRWARANAARLGIDPDRIVAGGESAGGHLAAAVALVPGFEDGDHPEVSSMPNALALFNPAVVLSPEEGHPGLLSDEKIADIRARTDGRPQEISPYHFVCAGLPPGILFHGTKDEAVPFPTVELFAKAMTAAGNRCELKAYEGQPHGFFNPGRGKGEPREEATRCFHRTIRELDDFFVSLGYLEASDKLPIPAARKLSDFQPLVRTETWTEKWPDTAGKAETRNVTAENITLEEHRRDGVHVNGPASDGLIRGVRGDSHDDDVALNAWEWKNYAPSYGSIERIVVEDVTGWPGDEHEGNNAIRLLPGVKRFDDGTTLDCRISDITLRRITDIRHFKIYDQPNLELGRDNDFSIAVGTVKNLRLEDLTFHRPGQIELHANTDGLSIHNVRVHHPITPDWHLLAIGPLSQTYQSGGPGTPEKWTEIFFLDLDCIVRNVSISGVRSKDSQTDLPIEQVVKFNEPKPNPDYPKTTPKGGTGKGIWLR